MTDTLLSKLASTVSARGDKPALTRLRGNDTETWTWRELDRDTRKIAKSLIAIGMPAGGAVNIIGAGAPEWVLADLGAILAGGMPAGIYTTNSKEQCAYIAGHSEASAVFTENAAQSAKFLAIKGDLPKLTHIVQWSGEVAEGVIAYNDFLELGAEVTDAALQERIDRQKPEDTATLIYTSGTTGEPKAVAITHHNITWTAQSVLDLLNFSADERCVSYLPLSHIAEQLLSVYAPVALGSHVTFAESIDKLTDALAKVRPTYFMGVPRVWEKIEAKLRASLDAATGVKKHLAGWARTQGASGSLALERGHDPGLRYKLADKLVFSKIRERLGLDQCRINVTAAAPIARSTLDFFFSIGLPIMEVYGMSECTGPSTVSLPNAFRIGKCGLPLPGSEVKIAEDGEVCMRGGHVFAGYYKNPEATKETLDDDGWLHTGDIGAIDEHGYLSITDRKKELLITAGGENVAPAPLEGSLRSIHGVSHAVVIGDRQKYLTALFTLDPEQLGFFSELAGTKLDSLEAAASAPAVRSYLDAEIAKINAGLARVQTIKRFFILRQEFSIDGGELTGTLKLKRKVVNSKYAEQIASLYEGQ